MTESRNLREIPSVSELLEQCSSQEWAVGYPRERITAVIRELLAGVRTAILNGSGEVPGDLPGMVREQLVRLQGVSLRRVVNASGIIVHTNLGRAPVAEEAARCAAEIAAGYSNLEFNLQEGERGSRETHVAAYLLQLLPTEASLVVNNNAAALLLILNSLAEGKEVIVSRGELVEIGGSFRLPEIMKKSGVILREVGTTNKTRIADYEKAAGPQTGMILTVHPSNYRIVGFTEKPTLRELVSLGARIGVPVVEDQGSGILLDLSQWGISGEPAVERNLQDGADLVCFSGDKILGGPQAGIICGRKIWIEKLRNNPLFRALRVDKMTYAALAATLRLYLRNATQDIPVLAMLSRTQDELKLRAETWANVLQARFQGTSIRAEETVCYIGGGVAPMKGLPSFAVSIAPSGISASELARRLREFDPPVISRIENDRVYLELRTLSPADQETVAAALQKVLTDKIRE